MYSSSRKLRHKVSKRKNQVVLKKETKTIAEIKLLLYVFVHVVDVVVVVIVDAGLKVASCISIF